MDVDVGILELVKTWNVKNNSNTNLKEVLDGLAVFIYDASDDEHNIGHTEDWSVDDNAKKEFDVVQELFNQVVPRNRKVGDGNYDLMDENGIFDFKAKNALALFKEHFKVDNTTDGSDFKKLVKDYSFVDSSWADQIIGKKILMGKDAGDNQINTSTAGDTGLYELYENVVKVFVKKIIEEADKYANANNKTWYARTGEKQGPGVEGGAGVSYCFGGKQDIGNYNSTVTSCVTPGGSTLTGIPIYTQDTNGNVDSKTISLVNPATPANAAVDNTYKGNINDTGCTYTGTQNYPGLYASEHRSLYYGDGAHYRNYNVATDTLSNPWPANAFPQFKMDPANPYWSGIDCSGLVQRILEAPGVSNIIGINITIPLRPNDQNVWMLFNQNVTNKHYYFARSNNDIDQLIKKGDLVRYGDYHVSIVYSDRSNDEGEYEIIHASGYHEIEYINQIPTFNRKEWVCTLLNRPHNVVSGYGRAKTPCCWH